MNICEYAQVSFGTMHIQMNLFTTSLLVCCYMFTVYVDASTPTRHVVTCRKIATMISIVVKKSDCNKPTYMLKVPRVYVFSDYYSITLVCIPDQQIVLFPLMKVMQMLMKVLSTRQWN